jgi:phage terminase large subunit-like protein
MDEEQKRLNNLKRIETWKKKKAHKAEIEAKKATLPSASPEALEKMHEIQTHLLPKTKIKRDQSDNFRETRLTDEDRLKAAAVARLLLRLKECRTDPIKFTEFVMKDPQGKNLVLKDFHKDWLTAFQRDGRIVVEASRNHAKTTILVSYILWKIGQNPNVRIKLFSQNDARARERIAEIANNIETNESYHLVFPEIKPKKGQWSNNRIVVERPLSLKDATVDGLGITTSATGGRCVVPGTLVIGPGGPKPIENFKVNDRVLSSDGKYHPITATAAKEYSGDIVVVKPECFEAFRTTPEHLILVCKWDHEGPKTSWIRADEIQPRDLLVIPRAVTSSLDAKHSLIPVQDITKDVYKGLVYDLSVQDIPNFVVPGATLHNCDVIALDDVCDLNNSVVYPTVRERIIQKFAGELLPMLDPGGQVISVATPYHVADLTATLKANPEFKHIRHVVGNDQDPMLPLWPERWDRPALQSLRIQQGAVEFDRAYRCLAFSGETVPCKPEWIKFYTKEELGDPSRMVCVQAYDLAIEQKSTSDYFAWVTILYDMERGKAFIADAKHERLSFSSQGHRIIGNFLRWNPDRIIIEKVGLGGSLENYLNENSNIRLPLVPHKPRGDKYFRLMQQLHWLEDQKCTFHPNMDPAKQVLDADGNLIRELLEFPVGRHDDLVDALTMALFALEEFRNHEAEAGWYDGGSMKAKMSVIG